MVCQRGASATRSGLSDDEGDGGAAASQQGPAEQVEAALYRTPAGVGRKRPLRLYWEGLFKIRTGDTYHKGGIDEFDDRSDGRICISFRIDEFYDRSISSNV